MPEPIDLDAIRARATRAVDGPWSFDRGKFGARIVAERGELSMGIGTADRLVDAEFIAHAREDIPALLAIIDQLTPQSEPTSSTEPEPETPDAYPF